ncbi:uncharacterized protein LOC134824135 [Bolinopsis microptera]|uniref:uncharacterized protein LOC134824135 n=1 Tax=Bolinopsis microptera TaxID=2820187 RepID=UPI0030796BFE
MAVPIDPLRLLPEDTPPVDPDETVLADDQLQTEEHIPQINASTSANEADIRIEMMMVLHEMLMEKVSVCFSPPTSSTKCGFNFNLIEDIVCGTQARLCLYIITKETGYAARAFSSIDVENAHSIINHLDRRGVQNSSIEELSRHVSNLQRLQILRKTSLGRKLYTPTSTIYHAPEIDKGLSDRLTSSQFDLSKPSGKNKELKPMVATMLLADKGELGPSVVIRLQNIYFFKR